MNPLLRSITLGLLVAGTGGWWQAARDPPRGNALSGVVPDLRAEQVGSTVIDPANGYSENTRVRISLLYPPGHEHAGEPVRGQDIEIQLEEWVSDVYDGRYGATALPAILRTRTGEAEFVLKSLARYTHRDRRNAPVPRIRISAGPQHVFLVVPQWVDVDGNGMTDWLERRVEDVLRQARASGVIEVAQVLSALQGWEESFKMDCGGVEAESPTVIRVSTVCLDDDLENRHRLNDQQELTATILHEAWHVWDLRGGSTAGGSRRHPQGGYGRCVPDRPAEGRPLNRFSCPRGYAYDALYLDDTEEKAEAFASRYRHLFH